MRQGLWRHISDRHLLLNYGSRKHHWEQHNNNYDGEEGRWYNGYETITLINYIKQTFGKGITQCALLPFTLISSTADEVPSCSGTTKGSRYCSLDWRVRHMLDISTRPTIDHFEIISIDQRMVRRTVLFHFQNMKPCCLAMTLYLCKSFKIERMA